MLIGTLYLKDASIRDISLDPKKFIINLDPQYNALNMMFQTNSIVVIVNVKLSLFGLTIDSG